MTISETLDTGRRSRRSNEPSIALLGENIYVVLAADETMGFVEQVGPVYVALSGRDLGRAVEVGQSLSWDSAVQMVWREYH